MKRGFSDESTGDGYRLTLIHAYCLFHINFVNSSGATAIAHFGREWQPGTQTKRARIYGIVWGNKSSSHLEYMTRHASCCVPSFSFTVLCFFLSIPPSVLLFWAVLTPLKYSTSLFAMFTVYIRVPTNNPINARAPSLGPRLSLSTEVSYTEYSFNIFQWSLETADYKYSLFFLQD